MAASDTRRVICRLAWPDCSSVIIPAAENAFTFSGTIRSNSSMVRPQRIHGGSYTEGHALCDDLARGDGEVAADAGVSRSYGEHVADGARARTLALIDVIDCLLGAVMSLKLRLGLSKRHASKFDAATFARAVRSHWGIENALHCVLDVVFHDDLARLRSGHGPANMAIVKHATMNLLIQAKPVTSLKNRRKRAGWNRDYLEKIHPAYRMRHSSDSPGLALEIARRNYGAVINKVADRLADSFPVDLAAEQALEARWFALKSRAISANVRPDELWADVELSKIRVLMRSVAMRAQGFLRRLQ
jgi:hypothetical protein